ncbi:MAG: hypothetical protein D6696_09020 [Acidobacteria bacterium]|nr:MAG: hypothetical protein D6696_09020 [Acidobacteriota bacterium]
MKRRALGIVLAAALALPAAAHVGSPNVIFEGTAGPYPVRVIVRPPGVVPGLAEITVRVKEGKAQRVAIRPVRWDTGLEGSPSPDVARPVRGDVGLFAGELWLMTSGSYSVHVEVDGELGAGTVIVPVVSAATERLSMSPYLGTLLVALAVLLFAGAVTAAGAAVGESVLEPGSEAGPGRRRAARWAMTATAMLLAVALYGGKLWWDGADAQHERRLARPLSVRASVTVEEAGHRTLALVIDDSDFRQGRWSPIVPDHGKLMHAFLIAEPSLDAFAHLHPVRLDHERFAVDLPPALPAGRYRLYADLTHASGYAHTLTAAVELPPAVPGAPPRTGRLAPDADDSWHVGGAAGEGKAVFDDGFEMRLVPGGPLHAGREVELRFALYAAGGDAAVLEPYMGMLSHAAVRRHDGAVFIHLHPTGTISMAAQTVLKLRQSGAVASGSSALPPAALDALSGHGGHGGHAAAGAPVVMPYEFPRGGPYRVWVQLKSGGRVYTGVFDLQVEPRG